MKRKRERAKKVEAPSRCEDCGSLPDVEEALRRFVSSIEVTGGVRRLDDGVHVPLADLEWVDIGEDYLAACQALGKKPVIVK